ncbi:histidine phosphatase family protein [Sphingobium lactosutens]|uniref:histidine phosphatase family protein n=1 Tax=Sphingobium lactosutens TaxID=522773 RepID=UPI0015BD1C19|nr:histidine phosphatase family protein [Sphingobium lactosutens]NWK97894.1 histidine phosphatase family protein [Sphingobium lactosutens]
MSNLEEFNERARGSQQRFKLGGGARQIILIRHGSSVGATVETVQLGELAISDPPLSEDGHVQAELLARALVREPINAIFVTPLQRTQQTAAPLATVAEIQPRVINDLREVHLGDWEHSFYEHASAGHPLLARMYIEESWEVIPNAESNAHFADRVRSGVAEAVSHICEGETAVIFSHAGTIAEICRQATGSRPFAFTAPENTSVSRLIVGRDGQWKLRSFNEVSHLLNE